VVKKHLRVSGRDTVCTIFFAVPLGFSSMVSSFFRLLLLLLILNGMCFFCAIGIHDGGPHKVTTQQNMLSSRVVLCRSAWSVSRLLAQTMRTFLSVPGGPRSLKVAVMGEATHKDPALSRLALLPAEAAIVTHGPTLDAMSLDALRSANVLFCATGIDTSDCVGICCNYYVSPAVNNIPACPELDACTKWLTIIQAMVNLWVPSFVPCRIWCGYTVCSLVRSAKAENSSCNP
jgi:hypothetical protein